MFVKNCKKIYFCNSKESLAKNVCQNFLYKAYTMLALFAVFCAGVFGNKESGWSGLVCRDEACLWMVS